MSKQKKNNRATLFKNENKTEQTHPDYKGNAQIDGVHYWIAGWLEKNESQKWIAISFKKMEDEEELFS